MLVFEEREKPEYPEKNLSKQGRKPKSQSKTPELEPWSDWSEASAFLSPTRYPSGHFRN